MSFFLGPMLAGLAAVYAGDQYATAKNKRKADEEAERAKQREMDMLRIFGLGSPAATGPSTVSPQGALIPPSPGMSAPSMSGAPAVSAGGGTPSPAAHSPFLAQEIAAIAGMPDPEERARAQLKLYGDVQTRHSDVLEAEAEAEAAQREQEAIGAVLPGFEGPIADVLNKIYEKSPETVTELFPEFVKQRQEQVVTQQELKLKHDYDTKLETYKTRLETDASEFKATSAEHRTDAPKMNAIHKTLAKARTVVQDIRDGNLRTGPIQQYLQLPTAAIENITAINIALAREFLKESGEVRPTDKDLETARLVTPGEQITEEENIRRLRQLLDGAERLVAQHEARGDALKDYATERDIFYFDVPEPAAEFEGYVDVEPEGGYDIDFNVLPPEVQDQILQQGR